MDIAFKVAIVTGAGNGIGREVGLNLTSGSEKVAGLDMKSEWLAETQTLRRFTCQL